MFNFGVVGLEKKSEFILHLEFISNWINENMGEEFKENLLDRVSKGWSTDLISYSDRSKLGLGKYYKVWLELVIGQAKDYCRPIELGLDGDRNMYYFFKPR